MNTKQVCEMNAILKHEAGYCHACSFVDKNTKRWKGAWADQIVHVWFNLYRRVMCVKCYELARVKRLQRREKLATSRMHAAKTGEELEAAINKYLSGSRKRAYADKDTETANWRDAAIDEYGRRGSKMQFDIRHCYISDEDI